MTLKRVTCTLSKKTRLSQITKFDDIYVIERDCWNLFPAGRPRTLIRGSTNTKKGVLKWVETLIHQ